LELSLAGCRGKRDVEEIEYCVVFEEDGSVIRTEYNTCEFICCGGKLTKYDPDLACCGNDINGEIYNIITQLCCMYDNSYRVYDKINENDFCCGLDLIDPVDESRWLSCCYGPDSFQTFNVLTEMCCEGIVSFVGDTAYGSCCEDVGYDRREYSCPCHVLPLIPIENHDDACCYSWEKRTAYNQHTQGCCGDVVFDLENQFCCDNQLVIKPVVNHTSDGQYSCCKLKSGKEEIYYTGDAFCCGEEVFYKNDIVGDACCDGVPFNDDDLFCCDGLVERNPYKYPACCVTTPYDAYEYVCCEGVIIEKPFVINPVTNKKEIVENVQCCGTGIYDQDTELCCNDNVLPQSFDDNSACCGDVVFDRTQFLCCDGIPRVLGDVSIENAICCGDGCIDSAIYYCCDGIPYVKSSLSQADFDRLSCDF